MSAPSRSGPSQPSFRLIYSRSLSGDEVSAAGRGLESFSRYGLLFDKMELSREALKGVRRKEDIMMAVSSERPVLLDENWFLRMSFLEAGRIMIGMDEGRVGIGLTAQPLEAPGYPQKRRMVGVSRFDSGAVVSVARMREFYGPGGAYRDRNAGVYPEAVRYAVMHEMGHILIERGRGGDWALDAESAEGGKARSEAKSHCPNKGCIMQENENVHDFVERFVKSGLDFCADCSARISSRLCSLRF